MPHHIFIVEDEEDIRDALRDVFEIEGYLVTTANNGKDALDRLSVISKPDIVLLDLMMPVMNGAEFLLQQKGLGCLTDVPVLIMSADRHTEQKSIAMGVKGHLKKPLELDELLEAVKQYCA